AFAFVIVPDALDSGVAAVGVPGPVALEKFVGGALGEFGGFERFALVRGGRGSLIAANMARAEGVAGPLRQIAGAIAEVAVLDIGGIELIAFVGGAMEDFVGLSVF